MEKFEKCTVAMLGGPCSQHVTGNTSRLNQPQSAINKDEMSWDRLTLTVGIPILVRRRLYIKINSPEGPDNQWLAFKPSDAEAGRT